MVDPNLLSYIRQKMSTGAQKETIRENLLNAGWEAGEVEQGFVQVGGGQTAAPQVSSAPKGVMLNRQMPAQTPVQTPLQSMSQAMPQEHWSSVLKIFALVFALIVLVGLAGGGLFWYATKAGLFGISPYTQQNLFAGLLAQASKIDSASYKASASLVMGPRDADATPFTSKLPGGDQLAAQYQNDYQRARDASSILGRLTGLNYGNKGLYAASLDSLNTSQTYSYYAVSIVDPKTQQPYGYTLTENGKNFALTITFETSAAISQIKKMYKFSDTTTIIQGKTVTFTKDSYSYIYISATPTKPFIVQLADYMAYVPPETKASGSVSAQTDFSGSDSADWKFNVDATGDFGDLTYKVNVDALKKDGIYYAKINNFPDIFFSYLGLVKGEWIKFDPNKTDSGSSYSPYASSAKSLSSSEKYYKEHRQEIVDGLKNIITVADQQHLFTFKNAPHLETVDGRALYRYDLQINKDAIVPFYKKLTEEIAKNQVSNAAPVAIDPDYIEYLQSPEFNELFDYYQKNTSLTLWVDSQGFPAALSYGLRIVPADSVARLKDKQANLVFKLEFTDINKPVQIDAPANAKDYQDIVASGAYGSAYAASGKDAAIKGYMSTILTNSAVYYDSGNSFANFCTSSSYTKTAASVTESGGSPVCKTNPTGSAFCACSSLSTASTAYCIDSTGQKLQTSNICATACTSLGVCK